MDLSQTEGDDEICPSNAHSTLSAKLSSAEEDVYSLRRSTEDFANINGFSMMVFIILMALLTHGHGMSFQDRCLGFPTPLLSKIHEDGGSWCTCNGWAPRFAICQIKI